MCFTIPTAVMLSTYTGVGGCGWSISSSISLSILASWALRKRAPNYAPAVDAATSLRIAQVMWILPFNRMFWLSLGVLPRKKHPPARLLAAKQRELSSSSELSIALTSPQVINSP